MSKAVLTNVLFAAAEKQWQIYPQHLDHAFAKVDLKVNLARELAPSTVDYIIYAPDSTLKDFTPFTRCKAVLSLWAGVETLVTNPTLTQPLCRMVDGGLRAGMVEYVVANVLRHHLQLDRYINNTQAEWNPLTPPLARDRKVTVLGLGELGLACADALHRLGFNLIGWSRTPKNHSGIECLHGDAGLEHALGEAEILVLLLPLTPATDHLLDAERLGHLPHGAVLINPGRGGLIEQQALLDALDSGQLQHATLDTFEIEPLPAAHPFHRHPEVTVTPHIASATRPGTAAEVIAENIARCEQGKTLLYQVDRTLGY